MSEDPRLGGVVGGRYELRASRGQDANGFVIYDGWHLDLSQSVVVQVVARGVLDAEGLRRFRNEARVLSRVRHPNVMELLDFGQLEDGSPFVVLPDLAGPTLAERLETGPLSAQAASELLLELTRALRFAHQFGVFHLAVSPENVCLTRDGAQILDLLGSRWHEIDGRPLVRDYRLAAPELFRGEAPAAPAEVYALGQLGYACLCGSLPLAKNDRNAARASHLSPRPWTLPDDTNAPRELQEVVLRCMSKEVDKRLANCDELIAELEAWQANVASTQRLSAIKPKAFFPTVGDVFASKYVIEAVIGQGGFARVFRARSADSQQLIALKILRPERTRDTAEARRFVREGKLVFSLLSNPHTISVYGYGETDEGLLYIAFEFLQGDSLESLLKSDAEFRADRVVRILEQCLVSLAEAHGMGVLHRDIKPSNIMLSLRDGVPDWVTVLDFGVAKIMSDVIDRNELTVAGKAVGTPRYMSPEQIAGDTLGPESDIYSLGLVTYELLTSEPAIGGDNVLEILAGQLDPQSAILRPESGVPVPLALIVNRMMRKERKSRYLNASEILGDLRQLDRDVGDRTLDTGAR